MDKLTKNDILELITDFEQKYQPKNDKIEKTIASVRDDLDKHESPAVASRKFYNVVNRIVTVDHIEINDGAQTLLKKFEANSYENGSIAYGTKKFPLF